MTLLDLLKDLTYGELAQLKMGSFIPGEHQSEPDPSRYEQLMSHVNLGLKEIYKRFLLSTRSITIQQYAQIPVYILSSKYAQSNITSTEPIKYILDTVEDPFTDDTLKIERIFNSEGEELHLNDPTENESYFTPTYRSIEVYEPDDAVTFTVKYRAAHSRLIYTQGMEPEDVEIMLPNALHEALLYYVASRVFASLGGDQGAEGSSYYQKFILSCKEVTLRGLEEPVQSSDWRFDVAGWV